MQEFFESKSLFGKHELDNELPPTRTELLDFMINNTCGKGRYKDDDGKMVTVYEWDLHCILMTVHVYHQFPDYEIRKIYHRIN